MPSASLWGCELKYILIHFNFPRLLVSLLVRLWVEICDGFYAVNTSLVSLLVRLWVEITLNIPQASYSNSQPPCEAVSWNVMLANPKLNELQSASLWGCELKYKIWKVNPPCCFSQPPCEAVSWNNLPIRLFHFLPVSLLVRLWVEIKTAEVAVSAVVGQPPCEAVSWNTTVTPVSSWIFVSLLVRLWVEIYHSF